MRFIKNIFSKIKTKYTQESNVFDVIKPGDIAIDCGANVGNVTEVMEKRGAKVFAFEPNPYAFEKLRKRFTGNKNVVCFQKGVYKETGILKLYLHEFSDEDEVKWSTGSSLLDQKGNVLKDKYVEVEIIDFNEFVENIGQRIKFVKMDVEGVEYEILDKLIETRNINKIDYLFVETHEHKIPELREIAEKVRQKIKKHKLKNVNLDWI